MPAAGLIPARETASGQLPAPAVPLQPPSTRRWPGRSKPSSWCWRATPWRPFCEFWQCPTIRRDAVEERVLAGLRERLLHPALLDTFIEEYRTAWNAAQADTQAARKGRAGARSGREEDRRPPLGHRGRHESPLDEGEDGGARGSQAEPRNPGCGGARAGRPADAPEPRRSLPPEDRRSGRCPVRPRSSGPGRRDDARPDLRDPDGTSSGRARWIQDRA